MGRKSDIDVTQEPEIQFRTNAEGLRHVRNWLIGIAGQLKSKPERNTYYDTKNNRLFQAGVECRVKPLKQSYRCDLKLPFNTHSKAVETDGHGILWRWEIQGKSKDLTPSLSMFSKAEQTVPLAQRVTGIFNKTLHAKFVMDLEKEKIKRDIMTDNGASGRVEYNLQTGRFQTPEGQPVGDTFYIVELELKSGDIEALHTAIQELKNAMRDHIRLLDERKIVQGFRAVASSMTPDKK